MTWGKKKNPSFLGGFSWRAPRKSGFTFYGGFKKLYREKFEEKATQKCDNKKKNNLYFLRCFFRRAGGGAKSGFGKPCGKPAPSLILGGHLHPRNLVFFPYFFFPKEGGTFLSLWKTGAPFCPL